jgi:hypothetical protein
MKKGWRNEIGTNITDRNQEDINKGLKQIKNGGHFSKFCCDNDGNDYRLCTRPGGADI